MVHQRRRTTDRGEERSGGRSPRWGPSTSPPPPHKHTHTHTTTTGRGEERGAGRVLGERQGRASLFSIMRRRPRTARPSAARAARPPRRIVVLAVTPNFFRLPPEAHLRSRPFCNDTQKCQYKMRRFLLGFMTMTQILLFAVHVTFLPSGPWMSQVLSHAR